MTVIRQAEWVALNTSAHLSRLRMAIPMHIASPPYSTAQPKMNINHADNGIVYSPCACSDRGRRFHKMYPNTAQNRTVPHPPTSVAHLG